MNKYRKPLCAEILIASAARSQTIRRRLGSVTLTGQGLGLGLGLGLGTSLFPVGAMEIKAGISAHKYLASEAEIV